jgi:hypothetical protein
VVCPLRCVELVPGLIVRRVGMDRVSARSHGNSLLERRSVLALLMLSTNFAEFQRLSILYLPAWSYPPKGRRSIFRRELSC